MNRRAFIRAAPALALLPLSKGEHAVTIDPELLTIVNVRGRVDHDAMLVIKKQFEEAISRSQTVIVDDRIEIQQIRKPTTVSVESS